MNHLYYRTRGNSDPHGKPRVFFASHPADFECYFNSTVEMLQRYNNCAVWYEDAADLLPDEELRSQLGEMQLVVIPVTTRLLTRSNRAMELVYPFALERHIPVLPLMMETGLDELFTRRFGDLQYLQPENSDPTALPFEQKLEQYISGVLVGEGLAQQVREAFDAYIFLSYRKKDRKYAQELMRLIHQNKQFRDIAIWYDEYLVPGESFNDAIRKALEKSELFTLVVTPSLLERGNYVMQEEYPAAQKSEKPILPVEMVKTSKIGLYFSYKKIPKTVRPQRGAELNGSLLEHLHRVALTENDSDPQHNFLIGLAYLDGIDVEVDNQRAASLITSAAETGHEAALRKLVSMYETGKGVERDYHVGAAWREKLVEVLRERYRESGSEEDYRSLFRALRKLGESLQALGKPDKARAPYEEMRMLAQQAPLEDTRRDLSIICGKLGDIEESQGRPEQAKKWYEIYMGFAKPLAEETGTEDAQRILAVSYHHLGNIERALCRLEQAKKWYEKCFAIFETLASETGTVEDRRDLSTSYEMMGTIENALGRPEQAKTWYEKNRAIFEALVEETGSADVRRGLAISFEKLGNTEKALGRPEQAKVWYHKSLDIFQMLAEETGTVEARRSLLVSYNKQGNIENALGRPWQAKAWYEMGLALSETLSEETGTVESRLDLARSYLSLGDIEKELGWPEQAKEWYEKYCEINEMLVKKMGIVALHQNLGISYERLGDIEKALGRPEQAKEWYEKSWEIDEMLAEEAGTVELRQNLGISYRKLGDIEKALGRPEQAKAWYEKSLALFEALAKETRTVDARRNLSISYNMLGDIEDALGRPKQAKAWYEKSLTIDEALAEETGTVQAYDNLAVTCYNLGTTGCIDHLRRAYDIWSRLAEQCPQVASYAKNRDIARRRLE